MDTIEMFVASYSRPDFSGGFSFERAAKLARKDVSATATVVTEMVLSSTPAGGLRQEALDWGTDVFESVPRNEAANIRRFTVRRSGLEALVRKVQGEVEVQHGLSLPSNLPVHGPWVGQPCKGRVRCSDEEAFGLLESAARFGGWLRVVAASSLGRRFLRHTQSTRGMNSPRTKCNLHDVAGRWPSPGAFLRALGGVIRRANDVLSPFKARVSWAAVAHTMECGSRTRGKAAIVAACYTIVGQAPRGYGNARDLLASHVRLPDMVEEVRNGARVHRDLVPVARKGHIRVFGTVASATVTWRTGSRPHAVKRTLGVLVVAGQRSWVGHHPCSPSGLQEIREAIAAWREQDDPINQVVLSAGLSLSRLERASVSTQQVGERWYDNSHCPNGRDVGEWVHDGLETIVRDEVWEEPHGYFCGGGYRTLQIEGASYALEINSGRHPNGVLWRKIGYIIVWPGCDREVLARVLAKAV